MAKGLLDVLLDSIFTDEWVGKRGEKLTERELKLVRLFGRKGKILRNIYIPKDNGETSEIDVIYITVKGIFVFESKNYSGWIFGNAKDRYWTAVLPNKQKNRFYNPIMQNKTHLKWMGKYLGTDIPLFSIIVFSERCELKKVDVDESDAIVIKRDRIYATVRRIWDANPDVLEDDTLEDLYNRLEALTIVDAAIKEAHVDAINKKYKKTGKETASAEELTAAVPSPEKTVSSLATTEITSETTSETTAEITAEITSSSLEGAATVTEDASADASASSPMKCPRCGRDLVIRTVKKGDRAGQQFYGCTGFPKCRFTRDINSSQA